MTVTVKELLIYPIKSCGSVKVSEAQTTRLGLALVSDRTLSDRRWMITLEGRQRDQRQLPRMALIKPSFTDNGLQLDAPGMESLTVPYKPDSGEIINIEPSKLKGRRYGADVSQWLSTFLEKPGLELIYFDDEFEPLKSKNQERDYPNEAFDTDVAAYHDMSPYHLASMESLADLNSRLKKPIEIYNFRPNIIVQGVDKPYGEDYWRDVQIGDTVKLRWFRSCLRCLLPTVNQQTGINDPEKEPWTTLQTYRRKPELYGVKAQFGVYLANNCQGIIRVGDPLNILREDKTF